MDLEQSVCNARHHLTPPPFIYGPRLIDEGGGGILLSKRISWGCCDPQQSPIGTLNSFLIHRACLLPCARSYRKRNACYASRSWLLRTSSLSTNIIRCARQNWRKEFQSIEDTHDPLLTSPLRACRRSEKTCLTLLFVKAAHIGMILHELKARG